MPRLTTLAPATAALQTHPIERLLRLGGPVLRARRLIAALDADTQRNLLEGAGASRLQEIAAVATEYRWGLKGLLAGRGSCAWSPYVYPAEQMRPVSYQSAY